MDDRMPSGKYILDLVDQIHEAKQIPRDVVFIGIEAAIQAAAEKAIGEEEESEVEVYIDRESGEITATNGDEPIEPNRLGRIAAQSAKQMIIQKIREAESDSVYEVYRARLGKMEDGRVQRVDHGTAIVALDSKTDAILPRSEQIPGQSLHPGERVKAVIMEVKRTGQRVKIVLSRCHPNFVRNLFEDAIPEIQDRTIEIKAIAREAGYRTKMAVTSIDTKVDAVGACVGVRGSRIKNVIEELGGERIDIVRWNDSLEVLIRHALQPAQISEVMLYPRLGRGIVLVAEDQLSLAIGRRGQNVRLGSKLVGWDIEIMTDEELGRALDRAERWFRELPEVNEEIVQSLIEEGFLSYTDITFIDTDELMEVTQLDEERADEMLAYAEEFAPTMESAQEEEDAQEAEAQAQAQAEAEAEAAAEDAVPTLEQLTGEPGEEPEPAEEPTPEADAPTLEQLFGPADQPQEVEAPVADPVPEPTEELPAEEPEPEPPAEDDEAVEEGQSSEVSADAER